MNTFDGWIDTTDSCPPFADFARVVPSDTLEKILADRNSYGRERLETDRIGIEHQSLVDGFLNHFSGKWYRQEYPVDIANDGIDESVYLIGAPISILKPYVLRQNIPSSGLCIRQECIRTKNTKTMTDDSVLPQWGSCFSGLVALVPFDERKKLLRDSVSYFLETLEIPLNQIRIQISSKDTDLIGLLEEMHCPIPLVFDEKPAIYYTHKYGMGEIVGRNFNFTFRERDSEKFNDVGNYIFIETGEKKYGVELALGNSVIMKEIFELPHVLDTSVISWIFPAHVPLVRKLQDCVISSILMLRSGMRPNASNTKWRILRSYLRGIAHFRDTLRISEDELFRGIRSYESLQYGGSTEATDFATGYLSVK